MADRVQSSGFTPNLDIIKQIESSGNPMAFNKGSKARGLHQITPIVLKEWNQFNKKETYSEEDLFDPDINTKIANWYFNRLVNHYAPHYGIEPNAENILAMYNWGLGNVRKYASGEIPTMPLETSNYIAKYNSALVDQAKPLASTLVPPILPEAPPIRRGEGKAIPTDRRI